MKEGLNDIRLSATIVAALYPKSLVQIGNGNASTSFESSNTNTAKPAPAGIKYLGNNARNITVVVNNAQHTFLPEDQLGFLTKILSACKLNIGDVAIVNLSGGATLQSAINALAPVKIISFGTGSYSLFTIQNIDGVDCTEAPAIAEMLSESEQSKSLKSKLWSTLKSMFEV